MNYNNKIFGEINPEYLNNEKTHIWEKNSVDGYCDGYRCSVCGLEKEWCNYTDDYLCESISCRDNVIRNIIE